MASEARESSLAQSTAGRAIFERLIAHESVLPAPKWADRLPACLRVCLAQCPG